MFKVINMVLRFFNASQSMKRMSQADERLKMQREKHEVFLKNITRIKRNGIF